MSVSLLKNVSFLFVGLTLSATTFAQNKPSDLVVSKVELQTYLQNKNTVSTVASQCLKRTWDTHIAFFNKYGISKYYGDRNPAIDTREERLEVIRRVGAPAEIVNQLEGISCIGLTRKCLKEGFEATQNPVLKNLWERIDRNTIANGTSGVVLIQHLQKLGWKVLYWNPRPDLNTRWDAEDPMIMAGKPVNWDSGVRNDFGQFIYHPAWGMHQMRYDAVMRRDMYYTVRVDDKSTLVGFDKVLPESFKKVPFFVGTAHAGYHVFPGAFSKVIEAHSMRRLDAIDNLEVGEFNPLASGGSPRWTRSEKYRSGVIAIPPQD
ncbi:hypothetical protein [Bdellovibrio sp. HCB-162]|uniref:hypothetical protein n=1 Tax=Bdellovibrio sp. HCB-162 TaxID=3394234 RepID=UPI0039BD4BEB